MSDWELVREHGRGLVAVCPRCGGTDGQWWWEDPVLGSRRHWDHTCLGARLEASRG